MGDDRMQEDGLPSVKALQALDEVIVSLDQAYERLMSDVHWGSVDGRTGTLVKEHSRLYEVLGALRTARRPFNITTVTASKVVRA